MSPRIYVSSLTDYNNGELHGDWIDATLPVDEQHEFISRMLAQSPTAKRYGEPAEEYAIHDHDGFHGVDVGEYANIERVAELAGWLDECNWVADAKAALVKYLGSVEDAMSVFDDAYAGEWDSERDYAENFAEDCGMLAHDDSEPLLRYVDWDAFARDVFMGDMLALDAGSGVYVFHQAEL